VTVKVKEAKRGRGDEERSPDKSKKASLKIKKHFKKQRGNFVKKDKPGQCKEKKSSTRAPPARSLLAARGKKRAELPSSPPDACDGGLLGGGEARGLKRPESCNIES